MSSRFNYESIVAAYSRGKQFIIKTMRIAELIRTDGMCTVGEFNSGGRVFVGKLQRGENDRHQFDGALLSKCLEKRCKPGERPCCRV